MPIFNVLPGFARCVLFATLVCGPVMASEIVSEDGTMEFDENGIAMFSGGTELFDFNHHPFLDYNPERLLPISKKEAELLIPVELDPVKLFKENPGGNFREAPGFIALMQQSAAGGLAASFSDMVLTEISVLEKNCVANGAPADDTIITPVYSNIRIHTNPIRTNAVLNVFSYKRLTCLEGSEDIDIPLIRRWVIAIEDGLQQSNILKIIDGNQMNYKMFARGEDIQLMAYYSNLTLTGERWEPNMRLISGYDQFGNVDPRDKYYDARADSCVDIDFKDKPPNDTTIWSVPPGDMRFCARGCIPGDISATQ